MQKKIDLAILTKFKDTKLLFVEQLQELLKNKIVMKGYSLEEDFNNLIEAEIILTTNILKDDIEKFVVNKSNIIIANRDLQLTGLDKLLKIPVNTKVLLVCSTKKSTIEIKKYLQSIGINHINYIPYFPGDKVPEVDIAITTGKSQSVPEGLEIIDIHKRQIAISTLIQILINFDLIEQNSNLVIAKYIKRLVGLSKRLHYEAMEANTKNKILKLILDNVSDGILFFDKNKDINIFNKAASKIFNINNNEDIQKNKCIKDFFNSDIEYILKNKNKIKDDFRDTCNDKQVISNIIPVNEGKKNIGTLAVCKDVTKVKRLEETLRRNLKKKKHTAKYHFKDIYGKGPLLMKAKKRAKRIAKSDSTILIQGETGTGKELFAQAIHNDSNRNQQPFIAINCATIPEALFESELFGYEEGAFTGAKEGGKAGVFEQAKNGTIFLDEIGDIPQNIQIKLLRVLEEREIMRVGSTKIIPVDVRIITATNVNLEKMVRENNFRKDLYYRLNVLPLQIPSLRNNRGDILLLFKYYLKKYGKEELDISVEVMSRLYNYNWPGNVRQLINCVKYISQVCNDKLNVQDLPEYLSKDNINYKKDKLFNEKRMEILNFDKKNEYLFILNELYLSKQLNENIGRRQIAENAKVNNIRLSAQMVRRRLDKLEKINLVHIGTGRQGTKITKNGIKVLKHTKTDFYLN